MFIRTFLVSILLLPLLALQGQISSRSISMSQGNKEAIVLELPTADHRLVEDLWSDFVKDNYDNRNKRNRRSKEMEALNIDIPLVSTSGKVDMYSVVNERGEGSELVVWIASNDGYISPTNTPARYAEAESELQRFALDVARAELDEQIEAQEKELKDLERELERLANNMERSRRNIEKAREEIAEEEQNIVKNEQDQETKRQQIEAKRQQIEATKEQKSDLRK